MKNLIYKINIAVLKAIFVLFAAMMISSCYELKEESFKSLAPISFNDVSDVINVQLGDKLVYDKLEIQSEGELSYEWGYGQKKSSDSSKDMIEYTKISEDAQINYVFTRLGTYVLRLKVDNGESIAFKYFTLNVNSGMDEGLLLLNKDENQGYLTFIKTLTEEEKEVGAKMIYDDVFSLINPGNKLVNPTNMYMTEHTTSDIQYRPLLISTDDSEGNIYKLEPKTFELYHKVSAKSEFGESCMAFAGDVASGSNAFYVFILGSEGNVARYDLFGDFITERVDVDECVEENGAMTKAFSSMYYTSATAAKSSRKPIIYNKNIIIQPGNAKVTSLKKDGYEVVNMCSSSVKNLLYVLLKSTTNANTYAIKSSTGTLGAYKDVVADTEVENICMDENSIIVNTHKSSDAYYSYNNAIYRWSLTSLPPAAPKIRLPEGEIIKDICTNYMGDFNLEGYESLLYVATYNPNRSGENKGSLYVYQFSDDSLVASYEGICKEPVKLMYKYRIN